MTATVPSKFVILALSLGLFLTFGPIAYAQSDGATPLAGNNDEQTSKKKADAERPAGWHTASHSNDVEPNYAVVFPQAAVNTITMTISAANWAAMQADMTQLFGEPGSRRPGGFGRPRVGITVTQPISSPLPPDGFGGPQSGITMTSPSPLSPPGLPENGQPPADGPGVGGLARVWRRFYT